MTDYSTIKIPTEDFTEHNERREELSVTWAEYIDGQAPEPPVVELDLEGVRRVVREELESVAR